MRKTLAVIGLLGTQAAVADPRGESLGIHAWVTQREEAAATICAFHVENGSTLAVDEFRASFVPGDFITAEQPDDVRRSPIGTHQQAPEGWRSTPLAVGARAALSWSPTTPQIELLPGAALDFELRLPPRSGPAPCTDMTWEAFTRSVGARAEEARQTTLALRLMRAEALRGGDLDLELAVVNTGDKHTLVNLGAAEGGRYRPTAISLRAVDAKGVATGLSLLPAPEGGPTLLSVPLPPGASMRLRERYRPERPLRPGPYQLEAKLPLLPPGGKFRGASIFHHWTGEVTAVPLSLEIK